MDTRTLQAKAELIIRKNPAIVFEAFVNPEIMRVFWFPKSTGRLDEQSEVVWYLKNSEDAISIQVKIENIEKDKQIDIEWGNDEEFTNVSWRFEKTQNDYTFVRIVESGFAGKEDDMLAKALDSTGGFNQLLIAAKAFLEYNVVINVVKDHAPEMR